MTDTETTSLMEIAHPSKAVGESIYGSTKVFPDYQAEPGESYLGMVHGLAHESSVSFVAVLLGIRAARKGFDSALYFFGIGALNCLGTRGFPTVGNDLFPGMTNENGQIAKFIAEGGKVYACMQDAMIEYARRGRDHQHHLDVLSRRSGSAQRARARSASTPGAGASSTRSRIRSDTNCASRAIPAKRPEPQVCSHGSPRT